MSVKTKDAFGNRMKHYESIPENTLIPGLPIVARMDGHNFHRYTKGMLRPFDDGLRASMIAATKAVMEFTDASIGYTQSDEITIIIPSQKEPIFNGRIMKLASILAVKTANAFNQEIHKYYPDKPYAEFDARVFNVPNETEAANAVLWREFDATKNSISSVAHYYCGHSAVQNLNGSQMQDKLMLEHNVNWNDYPASCKRGVYLRRVVETRKFTPEEIETLPPMHDARKNPDYEFTREYIREIDMPIFSKVKNREDVVFRNAPPIVGEALYENK